MLGTFTVSVNGRRLPPVNLLDGSRVDLTPALRAGTNTIVVHVNTLLGNAAFGASQRYGLVGPVVFRPYAEVVVAPRRGS